MKILQMILLAVVGYALYEALDHLLGELDKTPDQRRADARKRVTGQGDGVRARTDGTDGQSTSTVVGRGVVS